MTDERLVKQAIVPPLWSKLTKRRGWRSLVGGSRWGRSIRVLLVALTGLGLSGSIDSTALRPFEKFELIRLKVAQGSTDIRRTSIGCKAYYVEHKAALVAFAFHHRKIFDASYERYVDEIAAPRALHEGFIDFLIGDVKRCDVFSLLIREESSTPIRTVCFSYLISVGSLLLSEIETSAQEPYFKMDIHAQGWRFARVLDDEADDQIAPVRVPSEWPARLAATQCDPWSLLSDVSFPAKAYGFHSGFGGSCGEDERGSEGDSSQNAQAKLPATQHHHLNGRFGAGLLGDKVVLLTLLGGGAAVVAGWGLSIALIGTKRQRWLGGAVCVGFLALGITIWSWALYGSPWTWWKLWNPPSHSGWHENGHQAESRCEPFPSRTA